MHSFLTGPECRFMFVLQVPCEGRNYLTLAVSVSKKTVYRPQRNSLLSKRTKYLVQFWRAVNTFFGCFVKITSGLRRSSPTGLPRSLLPRRKASGRKGRRRKFACQDQAQGTHQCRFVPQCRRYYAGGRKTAPDTVFNGFL